MRLRSCFHGGVIGLENFEVVVHHRQSWHSFRRSRAGAISDLGTCRVPNLYANASRLHGLRHAMPALTFLIQTHLRRFEDDRESQ